MRSARATSPYFSALPITPLIADNSNGEYRSILTRSLETGENRRIHDNQRGRSRLILIGGGTFDRFSGLSSTEGPAINDAGQVVFLAILADGRRGVFVIEPTTLPIQIP